MSERRLIPRLARLEYLGSPRFVNAMATVIVATAASSFAIERIAGGPALAGVLAGLVVIASLSAFVRRASLDWQGILPISLLAFVAWSVLSVLWSEYQWATLSGLLYQLAFTVLGVYVALTRDMIQIVRVFGDVLRALLAASLAIEIFSGIIIDSPLAFLGVRGDLTEGGPIQGISGDASRLGILALVAGVTFGIELLTRSVPRSISIVSLAATAILVLLAHSNLATLSSAVVIVAALLLTWARHVRPTARLPLAWVLLAAGMIAAGVAVLLRAQLIEMLGASGQVADRVALWRLLISSISENNGIEGWGWVGQWPISISPVLRV